ncbi:hypothetical protein ASG82_26395 [Mycobacterium sp. Soil538]|nr:hypothetical protein ASG82_26395 [Mycobacterium sp. Soil538]
MAGDAHARRLRRLTTPRSAAVAGIVFAVLFAAALVLLRSAIPDDPFAHVPWAGSVRTRIGAGLVLAPVAAIAFLWFIGVMRDVLGDYEDRFFASVFFGSGLLFLAMTAVSMAIAGAILTITEIPPIATNDVVYFARSLMLQISNIWGVRMAAVFMISLATIWLRTGVMPRWISVLTYLVAATLIFVVTLSLWVTLIFPAWVGVVSAIVLVRRPPAR